MQKLRLTYAFTTILGLCLSTLGQDQSPPQCAWSSCDATHCEGDYPYLWARGTCGEFGCQNSLYCCEVPSPYIETYWVGTAVFCAASCNDCRGNDECIIPSNPCGDGQTCWTGTKVLCGSRIQRSAEQPPSVKTSSSDSAQRECVWTDCGDISVNVCSGSQYPYLWATGTCGASSKCANGETRLYCCNQASPYASTYWLGTSPDCGGSCDYCKVNDECIIPANECGDGDRCVSGSKALCGQLNPDEQLKKIPWYYYVIGAAVLVSAALIGIGGTTIYCCINCDCCTCR